MKRDKLNFLTSLKGIAAWGIVLFHIKEHLFVYVPIVIYTLIEKSFLSVDFFFVLSGFIISYNYLDSLSGLKRVDTMRFYLKRFVRIYPLHFLMLVAYISIPVACIYSNRSYSTSLYNLPDFILNLFMIHNWGMNDHFSWNAPSWAVSVEMAAYVLFPFLACIFIKFGVKSSVLSIIVCCTLIYVIYSLGNCQGIGHSIPRLGIVRGLLEFMIGIGIFNLYKRFSEIKNIGVIGIFLLIVGVCGVIGVVYFNLSDMVFIPISITAVLTGLLIFPVVSSKFLDNRVLVHIGKISYSTYMIHYFMRDVFKFLFLGEGSTPVIWIVLYCITLLIFSHLSFMYVESLVARFARRKIDNVTGYLVQNEARRSTA